MPSFNDIKHQITNFVSTKKSLLYIGLGLLFIIVAFYTYKTYIKPGIYEGYVANNEFKQQVDGKGASGDVELYFFYTNWCPHCKTAKPIWQELKSDMQDKKINGRQITFIDVDCDADTATAETFEVKGYPTIKLVKDGQVIEYDAKPDKDTLMEFLQTTV
jgi:thiol-disulfide isomerase/thioredoxin